MDIEAALFEQMVAAFDPDAIGDAMPAETLVERPHSFDQAIWLLKVHRDRACRRDCDPASALTREARTRTWDSIRRKVRAIERARDQGED